MTEDEAKSRWCPHARIVFDGVSTVGNRHPRSAGSFEAEDLLLSPSRCIGSACMAWRWLERPAETVRPTPGAPLAAKRVLVGGAGFCGLAGAAS